MVMRTGYLDRYVGTDNRGGQMSALAFAAFKALFNVAWGYHLLHCGNDRCGGESVRISDGVSPMAMSRDGWSSFFGCDLVPEIMSSILRILYGFISRTRK